MKLIEKWIKLFVLFLIIRLLPQIRKEHAENEWKRFKRVLVFRLDNRFGNSILILSLVQSIKESLPDVSIDVMMTSSYVALYNNHPAISSVIPYNQKYLFRNPIRFISLINRLRRNNYDAIFSSNNPDSFSASQAILCRLATKNRRVGFAQEKSSRFYSDIVKGNTNIHYSQSQFDLWRHFDKDAQYYPPKLYYIKKTDISPKRNLLIWLGARGDKILSETLVNSILRELKQHKIMYYLALGPHDKKIAENYKHSCKHEIHIIDLDLIELGRYFLDYKCIIMPDTGPMHLVAALGIPLIQVFVNSSILQYGYMRGNRFIVDKKINGDILIQFITQHVDQIA